MESPIAAIEQRAAAARIPMSRLCGLAGVACSTWQNAKRGKHQITLTTIGKLEAELARVEAERGA